MENISYDGGRDGLKERGGDWINIIRNEKGEVTTDTTEIQSILRDYYKQLYAI